MRHGAACVWVTLACAVGAVGLAGAAPRAAALAAAMASGDADSVRLVVREIRASLGAGAGVPEVDDVYVPVPPGQGAVPPAALRACGERLFRSLEAERWWRVGADPTRFPSPLRLPASVLSGRVAAARRGCGDRDEHLAAAREVAAFLMWAQTEAGSGGFPFPAARGTSKAKAMRVAAAFLSAAEKAGRLGEVVRGGWMVDDLGDGGLQFDNGECGSAMLDLYAETKDARYLDSARRAADWAASRRLCPNWNYNSFSVFLLAKTYAVTREPRDLSAALSKARLGVIPGQLTDGPHAGRWLDPHNARPAYHYIMMRALAQLVAVLPESNPERAAVVEALRLGLRARNAEMAERGVMTKEKALEALVLTRRTFASDPAFLAETRTPDAARALCALAAEELRQGKLPFGPGEWGQLLECVAEAGPK